VAERECGGRESVGGENKGGDYHSALSLKGKRVGKWNTLGFEGGCREGKRANCHNPWGALQREDGYYSKKSRGEYSIDREKSRNEKVNLTMK